MKNLKYIIILFFLFTKPVYGFQQESLKEYSLEFNYTKISNRTIILEAVLTQETSSGIIPVSEKPIRFFAEDTVETFLAEVKTGEEGIAILEISPEYDLPWNEENQCMFKVRVFYNNDEYLEKSKLIKNINIEFEFIIKNEEKYVNINISEPGPDGTKSPVYDALVYAYVKRLYNLFEFGAGFSDQEGNLIFDFPKDMPGDNSGNLTVIVKIPESDIYGNIEKEQLIDWGIPVPAEPDKEPRALWSDHAPSWMIIAVIIILGGAWIIFFIALSKILKIRNKK